MPPTVLLLQARRADDPIRVEERESFVRATGLPEENVVAHDLLEAPPTLAEVERFDALMIGGSGEFCASKGDLPGFQRLLEVLAETVGRGHPTFASCYGFGCLVAALGGEVVHDPPSAEVGTYELELTEAGREDPLFGTLPDRFPAQLGRRDRATRLPDGVVSLAVSERVSPQAIRIADEPIWATQFHPELDRETNQGRYLRYLDIYSEHMTPEERAEALERFAESRETERLLSEFLRLVFG